jgi:hypothetical protein
MGTYKELQDRINLDYLNQMTLVPETKRAIATAIRCYEARRFWFNEAATAVATTISQSYIAVPSDFLYLDRLEINYSGGFFPLREDTFDFVRNMDSVTTLGQPTSYAYRGDRFELAVIPNSAYAVNIYYVKSLSALSADNDTNAWTTEASNLIAHAATVELLTGVLQVNDQRKIDRHERAMYMALYELGMRNDTKFLHRLTPTIF